MGCLRLAKKILYNCKPQTIRRIWINEVNSNIWCEGTTYYQLTSTRETVALYTTMHESFISSLSLSLSLFLSLSLLNFPYYPASLETECCNNKKQKCLWTIIVGGVTFFRYLFKNIIFIKKKIVTRAWAQKEMLYEKTKQRRTKHYQFSIITMQGNKINHWRNRKKLLEAFCSTM